MIDSADCLRFSRSAVDLMRLAEQHPSLVERLASERSVLAMIRVRCDRLEAALDAERRDIG